MLRGFIGARPDLRAAEQDIVAAGEQAFQRMSARTQDRDQPTTWTTRQAEYDAVCAWRIPDHALLQRLSAISQLVFVANGDSDPMILPHYSYLLAGLIPQAQVRIYPDLADGFLFQHHTEFAADVEAFLSDPGERLDGQRAGCLGAQRGPPAA